MKKIVSINEQKNKKIEETDKLFREALDTIKNLKVSSFILAVEAIDDSGKKSEGFYCVSQDQLLTLTQGYLNHLFLDIAQQHLERPLLDD